MRIVQGVKFGGARENKKRAQLFGARRTIPKTEYWLMSVNFGF